MRQNMGDALGWLLGLCAGGVWGVAFFSWGLPLPIPARVVGTVVLVAALAVTSRHGLLAGGAFALGMGATSGLVVVSSGLLFAGWWGVVPASALLAGLALHATALRPFER